MAQGIKPSFRVPPTEAKAGIGNEISVSYTDENGKKQTVVHSNIDEATLQRVINELVRKLNNN